MWIFDRDTLRFLAVDHAAIRQCGYTEWEFLTMTISDIRLIEDVPPMLADVARRISGLLEPGCWGHHGCHIDSGNQHRLQPAGLRFG